jgi:hypothetical protein
MSERRISVQQPPYAALWKCSIWRIQLVSGFHLGKIWATNLSNTSPVARPRAWIVQAVGSHKAT